MKIWNLDFKFIKIHLFNLINPFGQKAVSAGKAYRRVAAFSAGRLPRPPPSQRASTASLHSRELYRQPLPSTLSQ